MKPACDRIYLSPPHQSGLERELVEEALASNWIAPLGPHVDAFEEEFCEAVGCSHAAALSSGTAALHLALILVGVEPGDEVIVSSLTFSASVNPIVYLGARPVFIDSERRSWNLDPALLKRRWSQSYGGWPSWILPKKKITGGPGCNTYPKDPKNLYTTWNSS